MTTPDVPGTQQPRLSINIPVRSKCRMITNHRLHVKSSTQINNRFTCIWLPRLSNLTPATTLPLSICPMKREGAVWTWPQTHPHHNTRWGKGVVTCVSAPPPPHPQRGRRGQLATIIVPARFQWEYVLHLETIKFKLKVKMVSEICHCPISKFSLLSSVKIHLQAQNLLITWVHCC